jgi:hypothetical protein
MGLKIPVTRMPSAKLVGSQNFLVAASGWVSDFFYPLGTITTTTSTTVTTTSATTASTTTTNCN